MHLFNSKEYFKDYCMLFILILLKQVNFHFHLFSFCNRSLNHSLVTNRFTFVSSWKERSAFLFLKMREKDGSKTQDKINDSELIFSFP